MGYTVALGIQFVILSYAMTIAASDMALAIGSYLYAIAASKCIKQDLMDISQSARDKRDQNRIRKQIFKFIDFHTRVKQLSNIL